MAKHREVDHLLDDQQVHRLEGIFYVSNTLRCSLGHALNSRAITPLVRN